MSADFKRELVVTDADVVTVGEIRAGADSLTLYLDTVGRPQIRDKETGSRVDDDGVVAADVLILENDVVVSKASDPNGRGLKRKVASGSVAQPGDDGLAADRSAPFELADGVGGRALGGPLGAQGFLVQDSCVQGADRGPGVDAEILGQGRFQSPIGLESVGLAFSDVVGGDQLCP